ncbi:MAG: hypothetical protein M0Z53_01000 [Thermaerobacter sp.]|nr:hypothetical protein [Thermaerobacter sp.]
MIPLVIGLGHLQIPRNHLELLAGALASIALLRWLERRRGLAGIAWGAGFAESALIAGVVGARVWAIVEEPASWAHPADWLVAPASLNGAVIGAGLVAVAVVLRSRRAPEWRVLDLWVPVALAGLLWLLLAEGLNRGSWPILALAGVMAVLSFRATQQFELVPTLAQTVWAWGTMLLIVAQLTPFPPFRWTAGHIAEAVLAVAGWIVMGRPWWRRPSSG